jgi:hypothetical protein
VRVEGALLGLYFMLGRKELVLVVDAARATMVKAFIQVSHIIVPDTSEPLCSVHVQ